MSDVERWVDEKCYVGSDRKEWQHIEFEERMGGNFRKPVCGYRDALIEAVALLHDLEDELLDQDLKHREVYKRLDKFLEGKHDGYR